MQIKIIIFLFCVAVGNIAVAIPIATQKKQVIITKWVYQPQWRCAQIPVNYPKSKCVNESVYFELDYITEE